MLINIQTQSPISGIQIFKTLQRGMEETRQADITV